MELLKNKKVLIALGLLVLGGGFLYLKNKKAKELVLSDSTKSTASTTVKDNYAVQNGDSIYQIIGGKKYGFSSWDNYVAYGSPAYVQISNAELDAIPVGGIIGDKGKVIAV